MFIVFVTDVDNQLFQNDDITIIKMVEKSTLPSTNVMGMRNFQILLMLEKFPFPLAYYTRRDCSPTLHNV